MVLVLWVIVLDAPLPPAGPQFTIFRIIFEAEALVTRHGLECPHCVSTFQSPISSHEFSKRLLQQQHPELVPIRLSKHGPSRLVKARNVIVNVDFLEFLHSDSCVVESDPIFVTLTRFV